MVVEIQGNNVAFDNKPSIILCSQIFITSEDVQTAYPLRIGYAQAGAQCDTGHNLVTRFLRSELNLKTIIFINDLKHELGSSIFIINFERGCLYKIIIQYLIL